MAWARVSGATLGNSANPASGTTWNAGNLGAAVLANDRLFAVVDINGSVGQRTVDGVSDSVNGAWVEMASVILAANLEEMSIWSVVSGAGTPSTITVTAHTAFTGSNGVAIAVGAYRGLSTTNDVTAIDISKLITGSGTTGDSGTTSGSTGAANELKLGVFTDAGGTRTLTAGTLDTTYSIFSKLDNSGSAEAVLEDADSGASSSTARATAGGWGVGDAWCAGVLVIKLATAVIPPGLGPVVQMQQEFHLDSALMR